MSADERQRQRVEAAILAARKVAKASGRSWTAEGEQRLRAGTLTLSWHKSKVRS